MNRIIRRGPHAAGSRHTPRPIACPWTPRTGRPVQLVGHFHNFRNVSSGGTSVISTGAGNTVMKDRILFDLTSNFSNIWTMRLPGIGPAQAAARSEN